jgi:hypothetical protein
MATPLVVAAEALLDFLSFTKLPGTSQHLVEPSWPWSDPARET